MIYITTMPRILSDGSDIYDVHVRHEDALSGLVVSAVSSEDAKAFEEGLRTLLEAHTIHSYD